MSILIFISLLLVFVLLGELYRAGRGGRLRYAIAASIIGLLAINEVAHSLTAGQAKKVYAKLVKANKFIFTPPLYVIKSNKVNAKATWGSITIYTGMLKFLRNEHELAMVLGHELAHYKLWHTRSSHKNEYAADKRGALYAQKAGYNKCYGGLFLLRFKYKPNKTHPPSKDRYKNLGCRVVVH
jgi:Zn-dependent protease with chaperone function